MNVLVLDSGRLFQKVLKNLLLKLDCTVDCADSGKQGFALLENSQQSDYDLVICSQSIFNQHLQEITEYSTNRSHRATFILLSSNANEALHINARAAGIENIFPKTNLEYLKSCIRYYIKGEQSEMVNNGEVLYIEDSASVAHITKSYLNKIGINVTHFVNADDAFKDLTSGNKNYDLIITDITLQGEMCGLSLVRMIRAENTPIAKTPILAMTGSEDLQQRKDLLNAGATDYITKPVSEEGFNTRVKNLITIKRLSDTVNQQKRALHKLTTKDSVTGCHNVTSLNKHGKKFVHDSARYKYPFSIIVIEVDDFKQLQEIRGRDISDKVLQHTAEYLLKICRQGDIVARIGEEEFTILLPHCSIKNASDKAEKILSTIQQLNPEKLSITASIGVSELREEHNKDFSLLYGSAKKASLSAKENGKNQLKVCAQNSKLLPQQDDIDITENTTLAS